MIVATRIPQLTEQFRAATIRAADTQRHRATPGSDQATARVFVRRLEQLGFTVTLRRAAA